MNKGENFVGTIGEKKIFPEEVNLKIDFSKKKKYVFQQISKAKNFCNFFFQKSEEWFLEAFLTCEEQLIS